MTRLLVVGPLPPPHSGWTHEVASVLRPPFTCEFECVAVDTGMRGAHKRTNSPVSLANRALRQVFDFRARVREAHPDAAVVFVSPYSRFWRDMLFIAMCHSMRVPTIIKIMGGKTTERLLALRGPLRSLAERQFSRSRGVIVELNGMVYHLAQFCPGVPATRVPNFIHPEDLPDPVKFDNGKARILYLGNMTPTKGVETIRGAIDLVCDRHDAEFHFVGGDIINPGYLDSFRESVRKLNHVDCVRIHGRRDRSEALRIASECHILAFPTQWPGEGVPAALVEAMGMGIVPVATRWRGVPEVVRHQENGLLMDAPDPRCLAESISQLIDNRGLWNRLSAAAIQTIDREYNADAALSMWKCVIDRALNGAPDLAEAA